MRATFPELGAVPLVAGAGALLFKVANWATVLWLAHDVAGAFTEEDAEAVAAELPGGPTGECATKWGEGELAPLSESSRAYHAAQLENWRAYAANMLGENPIALATANATIDNAVGLISTGDSPDGAPVTLCDVQAAALIIERQINRSANAVPRSDTCIGCAGPPSPHPDTLGGPPVSQRSPWLWAGAATLVAVSAWWLWRRRSA